jgi:hypothetical protein
MGSKYTPLHPCLWFESHVVYVCAGMRVMNETLKAKIETEILKGGVKSCNGTCVICGVIEKGLWTPVEVVLPTCLECRRANKLIRCSRDQCPKNKRATVIWNKQAFCTRCKGELKKEELRKLKELWGEKDWDEWVAVLEQCIADMNMIHREEGIEAWFRRMDQEIAQAKE